LPVAYLGVAHICAPNGDTGDQAGIPINVDHPQVHWPLSDQLFKVRL
jgi:hypothetical protein